MHIHAPHAYTQSHNIHAFIVLNTVEAYKVRDCILAGSGRQNMNRVYAVEVYTNYT